VDQIVKAIVATQLAVGERVNLILGVDIGDVRNRGVAFGLLGGGGDLVIVITVVVVVSIVAYFALNPARPGLWVPVGLLAGCALGNLADRARVGAVIDFIDPPAWPAFNLADVAIIAGIIGLFVVHGAFSSEP